MANSLDGAAMKRLGFVPYEGNMDSAPSGFDYFDKPDFPPISGSFDENNGIYRLTLQLDNVFSKKGALEKNLQDTTEAKGIPKMLEDVRGEAMKRLGLPEGVGLCVYLPHLMWNITSLDASANNLDEAYKNLRDAAQKLGVKI